MSDDEFDRRPVNIYGREIHPSGPMGIYVFCTFNERVSPPTGVVCFSGWSPGVIAGMAGQMGYERFREVATEMRGEVEAQLRGEGRFAGCRAFKLGIPPDERWALHNLCSFLDDCLSADE